MYRGLVVRVLTEPPNAPAVQIFDAGGPVPRSATYRRSDCRQFDVDGAETGETDDDVHDDRLDVPVICEHANGSYLSVAMRFEHCR